MADENIYANFEDLSPFEIKDELIKLARAEADKSAGAFLNAGRGNPELDRDAGAGGVLPPWPVCADRSQARHSRTTRPGSPACRPATAATSASRNG